MGPGNGCAIMIMDRELVRGLFQKRINKLPVGSLRCRIFVYVFWIIGTRFLIGTFFFLIRNVVVNLRKSYFTESKMYEFSSFDVNYLIYFSRCLKLKFLLMFLKKIWYSVEPSTQLNRVWSAQAAEILL